MQLILKHFPQEEEISNKEFFISLQESTKNTNKDIPVAFETAWVLAAAQANHIVNLCSEPSLVFRRRAASSVLGIKYENVTLLKKC